VTAEGLRDSPRSPAPSTQSPTWSGKWREGRKLPTPDVELATGPVWLPETTEPLLAAGGPEPQTPGKQLRRSESLPHDSRALPQPDR
jgi:hypothetical protein